MTRPRVASPAPATPAGRRRTPSEPEREAISLRSPALIVAALVAAACLVVSVSYKMYDPDIWENLVVGRAIWELHRVPTTQLWSWPTYGAPDVKWTWGCSALLWPVWERWGVWGLFAWRWATTLAAFGLLWMAARRMGARGFTPLVVMVVCGLVWRARSQVRPETLAAVLLAAQVWILETRRQGGKDHTPWLIPLAWAWANVHNTWFLGFGVIGIHLLHDLGAALGGQGARLSGTAAGRGAGAVPGRARVFGGRWRLLWVGLAALLISFANPYGWRALWQPFDFFLHHRKEAIFLTIAELGPVEWSIYWRKGLPLLVAGWPLLALWRARRRGADLVELLACAAFTAIALPAQRFLGLYAIVAAPYVARDLEEWLAHAAWAWGPKSRRRLPREAQAGAHAQRATQPHREGQARTAAPMPRPSRVPVAARGALTALACVAVCLPEWERPEMPIGVGFQWNHYPVAACDFMEKHGVRGRGFTQFGFAGYQLYRFWPDRTRLPFIDIHQAGTKEDRYAYAYAQQSEEAWRLLDRKYRFDYVLHARGVFERYGVLNQLDGDSTWAMVFLDDVMALYVRRDGPLAPLARTLAYHEIPGGGNRLTALGEACARDSLLRVRVAAEVNRVIAGSPEHGQALLFMTNLAAAEGRYDDARALALAALAIDRFRQGAHMRLALLALREGRAREALRQVAAERDVADPSPRHDVVEGRAWARLGDLRRARAAYRRALERDPQNAEARDSLAAIGGG